MPASFINLCGQKLVFLYLRGLSKKVTGLGGLHQQNYLKERNFRKLTLASLVAQRLKRLPSMRETRVWSLGREDPLEKERATYSSILAWRIPWTEEPGRLQSTGLQRVRHDWATSLSLPPLWFLVLLTVAVMDLPSLDLLLVEPTADIADSQTSDAMILDPLGVPQDTSP